jgi:MoxR-like ATPase
LPPGRAACLDDGPDTTGADPGNPLHQSSRDGPLTVAARIGAICYLDEVVEARQVTTLVIHPLTDHRRQLPLEKKGELVQAHPDFQIVISYNPGYQSLIKDLKQSTKQRFGALDFDYPSTDIETEIVAHEGHVDKATAEKPVQVAQRSRNLKGHGLDEGMSTRLPVYAAAQLIGKGIDPQSACRMALVRPLTDGYPRYAGCCGKYLFLNGQFSRPTPFGDRAERVNAEGWIRFLPGDA